MAQDTKDNYKVIQFTSQEDFWITDGDSEFMRQVNKEGDDGWEFVALRGLGDAGAWVAVLRRDGDYYRQDL